MPDMSLGYLNSEVFWEPGRKAAISHYFVMVRSVRDDRAAERGSCACVNNNNDFSFWFRKIFEFLRNISEAANLSERDNRIFILIIIIY